MEFLVKYIYDLVQPTRPNLPLNLFGWKSLTFPIYTLSYIFYLSSQDRIRTCIYTTIQLSLRVSSTQTRCMCVTVPPPDQMKGLVTPSVPFSRLTELSVHTVPVALQ